MPADLPYRRDLKQAQPRGTMPRMPGISDPPDWPAPPMKPMPFGQIGPFSPGSKPLPTKKGQPSRPIGPTPPSSPKPGIPYQDDTQRLNPQQMNPLIARMFSSMQLQNLLSQLNPQAKRRQPSAPLNPYAA